MKTANETKKIVLDYYYGAESEQFSFFRIPRALFTDPAYKDVSPEAKILYGLMLDRMGLSTRNGWVDEENRVYIYYTLEEAMDVLAIGHTKGVTVFSDLEKNGLIERKKQGLGKPTIIYIKNFIRKIDDSSREEKPAPEEETARSDFSSTPLIGRDGVVPEAQPDETEVAKNGETPRLFQTSAKRKSGLPDRKKAEKTQTSGKRKSGLPKNGSLDFRNPEPNYTYLNYTEKNYTEREQSIYPIEDPATGKHGPDPMDAIDSYDVYVSELKENLNFDGILAGKICPKEKLDGIISLMADIMSSPEKTVRLGRREYPTSAVRKRFSSLTAKHVEYVLESLNAAASSGTAIRNIRAYLLTALYNAPDTMDSYYDTLTARAEDYEHRSSARKPTYDLEAYKAYDFFDADGDEAAG